MSSPTYPLFTAEQVILVTGASSGIGQAIALQLNAHGATVIACGRNEERLEQTRSMALHAERWVSIVHDLVQDLENLPAWISELRSQYGKFWGLVNAAGTSYLTNVQSYDLAKAQHHYDINLHAPLMLAKGFTDRRNYMPGGALLFIASAAALFPEKGHIVYGAAKAALANAAKVISQEMAPRKLRVHCLAPGIVDTPMQQLAEQAMGTDYRQQQLSRYPLGFGAGEDIAHMVSFLLSEKARWITGQNFVLSGGCY